EANAGGLPAFAGTLRPYLIASVSIGAMFVVLGVVAQRMRIGRAGLALIDAFVTAVECIGFDLMLLASPPWAGRELTLALLSTNMLLARAAVVPSTGRRSALVGVLAIMPLVVAAYILRGSSADGLAWARVAYWGAVAVLSSSLVSRRLYAMQRQVEAARRF